MQDPEATRDVAQYDRRLGNVTLKQLITDRDILIMPGVFDGLSARLVQSMGYRAAFVTGAGLAESRLGVPDIGLMGMAESLEGAAMIASRTSMLLLADGDTGYGNAVNAFRTVQHFEQAGLAGIMLEDQVWPKRCGHMSGKLVISADEMVDKIRAAARARRDPDFVIKARTDAAATHGIGEAIRRANLYASAGADLVFADALVSVDDIAAFARLVDAPVAVNMGLGVRTRSTTPLVPARTLERMGVAVVIYPRLLTTAAMRGMQRAMDALSSAVAADDVLTAPDYQVSFEEYHQIMGMTEFAELEATFVPSERTLGSIAWVARSQRRSSARTPADLSGPGMS
jgi:2-methylisocitrate lyase-like PEP mutase family enzyme